MEKKSLDMRPFMAWFEARNRKGRMSELLPIICTQMGFREYPKNKNSEHIRMERYAAARWKQYYMIWIKYPPNALVK